MTGKDSKKGVNKSSSSGQAVQNGGQNTVVQSGQAVGQCQAFVQAQGQGQQGYIASLSQGNPISLQDFNQGAQIMQPVQTQYMQNQMQNTNMTNNRIVCDQGVPQATYMCNLQSGALNTNTQANGLNQRHGGQQGQNYSIQANDGSQGSMFELVREMNSTFLTRLNSIDIKMSKLEPIEKEISFARYDITALKRENSELRQKVDGVETSCATISSLFDNYKTSCEKTETDVKTLQLENSVLRNEISVLTTKHDQMKEELLELKARSMQENLLFFGLGEPPRGQKDSCEMMLRDFLKCQLQIADDRADAIVFDRVHRLGKPKYDPRSNPRPIVAKFENFPDREVVRKAGIELNKRRNGFSVREQFPPEIEERRKKLYPVMRRYLQNDENRVSLVRDKLYVNGKLYEGPLEYNEIPQNSNATGARPKSSNPYRRQEYADVDSYGRRQETINTSKNMPRNAQNEYSFVRNTSYSQRNLNRNESVYMKPRQNISTRTESSRLAQTTENDVLLTNFFSPLQQTESESTPIGWAGKKKATSPLIEELESKKVCENAKYTDSVGSVIKNSINLTCGNEAEMEISENVQTSQLGDTDYTEQLSNIHEQLSQGPLPSAFTNDDTSHTNYNGVDD